MQGRPHFYTYLLCFVKVNIKNTPFTLKRCVFVIHFLKKGEYTNRKQ